jgi:hypothetical protein
MTRDLISLDGVFVLHYALELAGIADIGPIQPFLSELSAEQKNRIRPVVEELLTRQTELVAQK